MKSFHNEKEAELQEALNNKKNKNNNDNDAAAANDEEERKKKQRKRNKEKSVDSLSAEQRKSAVRTHAIVMPKSEWKKLRNRYLNLQRNNMSKAKKRVTEKNNKRVEEDERHAADAGNNKQRESRDLEIKPGTIVRFECPPDQDRKDFKKKVASSFLEAAEKVKYVDINDGLAYVRCEDEEFATKLSKVAVLGKNAFVIQEGQELEAYRDRAKEHRRQKLNKEVKIEVDETEAGKKGDRDRRRGKKKLEMKIDSVRINKKTYF